MKAERNKEKTSVWMLLVNIVTVAAMVVTLVLYMRSNTREEQQNRHAMLTESAVSISDTVRLYFINQNRDIHNHRFYISPDSGDCLSYEDAVEYLKKANADSTINYQIIDPLTYQGVSLIRGKLVEADYTFETYLTVREACDAVAEGGVHHENLVATSVFANSSNGAALSIALYTDISVEIDGRVKTYVLLAVIETENIIFSGLPAPAYRDAGACIIDKNGDYIMKDDRYFRSSENFYKFLRVYNSLTYPQMDEVIAEIRANTGGTLEYKNFRGEACYYPYSAIAGTDGWYYVASVPVASAKTENVDYAFTFILLLFLAVLVLYNGMRMKKLNNILRSSVVELEESRSQADAANEAKTLFLAHMSHEMRTPLNAIMGIGLIAKERTNDPEVKSFLTKIGSASEHLFGIINDVLDISKIGEGKLALHREPFSLREMAEALSTIYAISASEKGISLVFNNNIEINRYLIGDHLRLRQVMTNLISNAIKYNNPGGFVRVNIRQEGEPDGDHMRAYFEVEDNGFGISDDKQDSIFEPFSRDYTDLTRNILGSGLGLAISSRLIEAMGGEIAFESKIGVGSRFYFSLDFELGESIAQKDAEQKLPIGDDLLKGLRILVAEDNEMNAFIVETLLRKVGAEVVIAQNGKKTVELVENNPDGHFDLILMDILMPIMDGYEATARIRAMDSRYAKSIPIAALSANAFNEDIEISLSRGMQAHLAKPINIDELYKTILELVQPK